MKDNQYIIKANFSIFILFILLYSCQFAESHQKMDTAKAIRFDVKGWEEDIRGHISNFLSDSVGRSSGIGSISLQNTTMLSSIYKERGYQSIWIRDTVWRESADSFRNMIVGAKYYGLFPVQYHAKSLTDLASELVLPDKKTDPKSWATGDILLTDALITFARHLQVGRIPFDSIALNPDSLLLPGTISKMIEQITAGANPKPLLEELEPMHPGYHAMKQALRLFLDNMDNRTYTRVDYPWKDSIVFVKQLKARLFEEGLIGGGVSLPSADTLKAAIKRAQQKNKIVVDGKWGPQLIGKLNDWPEEQFRRIAINLDRFKQLPDRMPDFYVWVNIPSYNLLVFENGRIVMKSKVIVGRPRTRTPVLNGSIYNFVTYPQWTVPTSITFNEMIPKIKKSSDYLNQQQLMIVDRKDSVISPDKIDWSTVSRGNFPYILRQRQGDGNSLGVIKFNFKNKYNVYLHDTNARSLFSNEERALSHGCVRVKDWDTLSRLLLTRHPENVKVDSVQNWLKKKQRRTIGLKEQISVYLRYFTADVNSQGGIEFYQDIYGEDNLLRVKYFNASFAF